MLRKTLKIILLAVVTIAALPEVYAQRLIEYTSGMGARDGNNPDVWILYNKVRAKHDDMTLLADSALLNTVQNDFTAYRNIVIELTDTTFIYGDRLYYDGNARVANIWADTVLLVDGSTTLRTNHITYDRNRSVAYYTDWGHGESGQRVLDSKAGMYNSQNKEFYIKGDVRLRDSTLRLFTDTLLYNTVTSVATFVSPTNIYTDSTHIYSEDGTYNTDLHLAVSHKSSHVKNRANVIDADTLIYDEPGRIAECFGNVIIKDDSNGTTCYGRYGLWHGADGYSFVTDSALVAYAGNDSDSLYLHADTIYIYFDSTDHVSTVNAYSHVKAFRPDAQAMSDSVFYSVADSVMVMYGRPVVWYDNYQCIADTIELHHDSSGVTLVYLRTACDAMQRLDAEKFNRINGRQGVVYFKQGEPDYADVLGSARMVFYITEADSNGVESVVGVNLGVGSDMRIYFDTNRSPRRMVAFGKPDMRTYPLEQLPDDVRRYAESWLVSRRPKKRADVFVW
ncbi:MAG: hypothetical protein K5650_07810 [Bacteroidales bacterium]|nr:hypothetical protein [Bacteroidales bacterium]